MKTRHIKSIVTAILLITSFTTLNAQMVSMKRTLKGITLSSTVTGNGFTGQYSAGLYRTSGRNTFNAEIMFPKSCKYIAGTQAGYQRSLLDASDSFSGIIGLYWFARASYNHRTQLNHTSITVLERLSPEFTSASTLKYRTIEGYTGIGITGRLNKTLTVFTDIGFGYFKTIDKESTQPVPSAFFNYRSDADIALTARVGAKMKLNGLIKKG